MQRLVFRPATQDPEREIKRYELRQQRLLSSIRLPSLQSASVATINRSRSSGTTSVDPAASPPVVCTVLLSNISRFLGIEHEALGVSRGPAETVEFVEGFIHRLEGDRSSSPALESESGRAMTMAD